MRGFANVFLLEMRLRKAVFPAALVTGLIPIPMALLMTQVATFSETVNVGAAAFALIGGELLALYLGATVLCQDLSEGRSGFYLSKPVAPLALWAGKLLGAWLAVLGAVVVCLVPATLLGGGLAEIQPKPNPFFVYDLGPEMLPSLWTPLILAVLFLGVIAFAHALSVMFRARSPWLILDAAMVILLPALAWWAIKRVFQLGSAYILLVDFAVLCALLFASLLTAGAVQTLVGRADLKRGHKALSLTLWAMLGLGVLALDAHALWATNVTPADLAKIAEAQAAPAGPWMVVSGPLKHRGPDAGAYFLLNSDTGSSRRLLGALQFSPDGRRAVSFEWRSALDRSLLDLVEHDLSPTDVKSRPTHIVLPGYDTHVAFAPDGSRLAVLAGEDLSVYDLPSWKLAAAQKIPGHADSWRTLRTYFVDRDTLRLCLTSYRKPEGAKVKQTIADLFEFEVPSRKLSATGTLTAIQPWTLRVNAAGDRLLVAQDTSGDGQRLLLCDAKTGEVLKSLAEGASRPQGSFLADGRILVTDRMNREQMDARTPRALRVFSPDGAEQRAVALEGGERLSWGREPAPGKVWLFTWGPKAAAEQASVSLLDVGSGTVQKLESLHPVSRFEWWFLGPRLETAPGSPGSKVFLDDGGHLIRYDVATGAKTPIKGF